MKPLMQTNKQLLIKVCGLTRAEDVAACHTLGADLTGFIFYSKSPRYVSPEQVAAIPNAFPARVGVFMGYSVAQVRSIMHTARLQFAQLHGDESVEFCRAIGAKQVIKVLWPERYSSPQELHEVCQKYSAVCAMFLLDAGKSGGGHGKVFSHKNIHEFSPAKPWLLAGGLRPFMIEKTLSTCLPDGIDINSGVETSPGIKDVNAIKDIIQQLHHKNNT